LINLACICGHWLSNNHYGEEYSRLFAQSSVDLDRA